MIDFSQPIALFPLPGITLFPGGLLPLRVFEPRYVAMMEYTMALERPYLVMLNSHAESSGDLPVSGIGRVLRYESQGDGTYGLLLEGEARVRLNERPQKHAFRLAEVEECTDDESRVSVASVEALKAVTRSFVSVVSKSNPQISSKVDLDLQPGALADLIMSRFVVEGERQAALETLDVETRLGQATEALLRVIDTISERPVQ